jgi:Ca2+-binding EF-hand superfamily protein
VVEAQARVQALFSQLDADHNGQLSAAEFGKMAAAPPPPNPAAILGPADFNRDGQVTLVEFRTLKLANFDRMDADKDGVVSVAEMKAAGLIK